MRIALAVVSLGLTGCYSVVTVNLGSVNHQASTTGKELPPEVLCAALVGSNVKLDGAAIEAVDNCVAVAKEKVARR